MQQLLKWVPRRTLEEIYKLYVRPHMDYGDILYDISDLKKTNIFPNSTSNLQMEKIEMIQYKAARIVTGAWQGTSRTKLYDDLGWETLQNRRSARKLFLLFEVQKESSPTYLANTLDNYKYNQNSRNFNRLLLKNIPCRTIKFKQSCFPSAIRDWNLLNFDAKSAVSLKAFKNKIFNLMRPKKKSYFGLLNKEKNKYITLLRMELSPLRAHKFKYNFQDTSDPFCSVCGPTENTEHFLLDCLSFRSTRADLILKVSSIIGGNFEPMPRKKKVHLLLYGDNKLSDDKNRNILDEVGDYIVKSKRLNTI